MDTPSASPALRRVTVGHSPDPDDAFMFHGIACGKVDTAGFAIDQLLEDIESLNRRCIKGEIEVSAVSIHAYAHLTDRYALMHCGASMGDGYGPRIVCREALSPDRLADQVFAVPGTLTSAFLALQLFLGKPFEYRVVPFDRILETVRDGEADAGLVIHEGQLTYGKYGLSRIVDLGEWWGERTGGLPLPLGGKEPVSSNSIASSSSSMDGPATPRSTGCLRNKGSSTTPRATTATTTPVISSSTF